MKRLGPLLIGACVAVTPLLAQGSAPLELAGTGMAARFRSSATGNAGASSGVVAGAEARLLLGAASLRGWYVQGRLTPDTGTSPASDLVEAGLVLAVRASSWLTLGAGPRVRAFVLPGGTERWVVWEARARLEEGIVGGVVRAHVELRTAVWAMADAQKASNARGGEAGVTARLPRSAFWARLTYAIDHAELPGGAETLEGVALTVGFGGR